MIVMQGQGFLDISPSYPLNEVADDLAWIHLVDVQARATSFKRGASRGACTWPYFRSGSMRINVNSKSKKKREGERCLREDTQTEWGDVGE